MNYVMSLLCGDSKFSHYGVGFAKSALLNQIGFLLNQAVRQAERTDATPVADVVKEAMGEALASAPTYDAKALTEAMAAAFVVCSRHAKKPDPANGRPTNGFLRFITTPENHIEQGATFELTRQKQRIEAAAAQLQVATGKPVDTSKAIGDIEASIRAKAKERAEPVMREFAQHLKGFLRMEDAELCKLALDAFEDTGRSFRIELRQGAKAILDSQRKAMEAGKFVTVDPTIVELAGGDVKVEAPATDAPTSSAASAA